MKVVVTGGGMGGFSAAVVARKVGVEVTLIERADMLGGLAMGAGMGLSGFWQIPVTQERALGGADQIDVFDSIATHRHVNHPGHKDVLLYNVTRLDAALQKTLKAKGIEVILGKKVVDIEMSGNRVEAAVLDGGTKVRGDAFVDATGTVKGTAACEKFGFGCVDCIYRCPAFGNPGGLVERSKDGRTFDRISSDGKPGTIGTSVMVSISSLSAGIQKELQEKGWVSLPIPPGVEPDLVRFGRAGASTTALMDQEVTKQNLVLVDVGGFVKVTATGSPLYARSLRKFPGLEDATIWSPLAGARGHLVHGLGMAVRDNTMKAEGFANLFVAGTKSGPSMCLTDAMVTGDLAGCNAAREAFGKKLIELPLNLAAGAYIAHVSQARQEVKRGFQGVIQMELLKGLNVYREGAAIAAEVDKVGLRGVYQTRCD